MKKLFDFSLTPALDANGDPLASARLYFYITGTTTDAEFYLDQDGTSAGTNPLVADSAGRFDPCFLDERITYRALCTDSSGSTVLFDIDPVGPIEGSTETFGVPLDTFFTATQRAEFDSATGGAQPDVTTAATSQFEDAVDESYINLEQSVILPPAKMKGPLVYKDGAGETRSRGFTLSGTLTGEVHAQTQHGTIVTMPDTTTPAITLGQPGTNQGSGYVIAKNFRTEGSPADGVPILDVKALYSYGSWMRNVDVVAPLAEDPQTAPEGDGVHVTMFAGGVMEHMAVLGPLAQNTSPGTVRKGTGFFIKPSLDCGLQELRKVTSKGWKYGYRIGTDGTDQSCLAPTLHGFECANNTIGVDVADTTHCLSLTGGYMEGIYDAAVENRGRSTWAFNLWAPLVEKDGWRDTSPDAAGSGVIGGMISGTTTGEGALAAFDGTGGAKTMIGTTITYGGAYNPNAEKTGLKLTGHRPTMFMMPSFPQYGEWAGTAKKIDDQTTSENHPAANKGGTYGVVPYDDMSGYTHYMWSRGSIRLHVDPVALTDDDVVNNLLTLRGGSVYFLDLSTPTQIYGFTGDNLPDATVWIFSLNGNAIWQDTGALDLSDTSTGNIFSYDPPNGASRLFQIVPSGTPIRAREVHRTLNWPKSMTYAELSAYLAPRFPGAETFVSDGRKAGEGPGAGTGVKAWSDGTNWRTFYDNSVVAA